MVKTGWGLLACTALLGCVVLAGSPMLLAQSAPSDPVAATSSAAPPAQVDSIPPITVQIEPPPISISSSMIGVAGPLGAKAAEGKPIFAEFVTQHHQDFTDGNSIARSTPSTIYRDAQGRIRRESQLSVPGLPQGIAAATFITIVDWRLGCGWVLNPQEMVAHRYPLSGQGPSYVARLSAQGGGRLLPRDARSAAEHGANSSGSRRWRSHVFSPHMRLSQDSAISPSAMSAASAGPQSDQSPAEAPSGVSATAGGRPEESGYDNPSKPTAGFLGTPAGAPSMRIDQPFLAAPNPVRTENLGEEMILGFRAHGTRVITTVPAGEIGNDRSIDIVSEQWYSPDLDLVMRSMHRDPWGGEFTTTVTRISQGEQAAHLFTVPPKYKVMDADSEGQHHVIEIHGSHAPGRSPW